MFRMEFDYSEIESFKKELDNGKFDLAVEKALKTYLSRVYNDLAKIHGRRYSYETPPSSKRSVLRMRTRGLLDELRDARYTKVSGGTYEGGFKISRGSILWTHEGSEDPSPVVIHPVNGEYLTIPLRAAMNGDGSSKRMSARSFAQMRKFLVVDHIQKRDGPKHGGPKIIPITLDQLNAKGENTFKLKNSLILGIRRGRKVIPYFILAKHVEIPKRIFIQDSMDKFFDEFFNQLDKQVQRYVGSL